MTQFTELAQELETELTQVLVELRLYQEKGMTNNSAAARIRKSTLALAKIGKEFRKESVAHHKK